MMDDRSVPVEVPEPAAVLAALDRILASDEFQRSPRSRDFLAYVVTQTVAGNGEQISERTVGRRALGHDAEFDGSASSSVRVRANRVRRSLANYYSGQGRDESVRISVPPGRYIAAFETHPSRTPARQPPVPGVAVVGFEAQGGERAGAIAASLSEALTNRLSRYPHIRVIGPTALVDDVQRTGAELGVSAILVGHVRERPGGLRVSVRLHAADTGAVIWSTDHVPETSAEFDFEAEGRWTREIAARIGDPSGLVVRHELRRPREARTADEAVARLAFYAYLDTYTVASLTHAVDQMDQALAAGARSADLLAMRAAWPTPARSTDWVNKPLSSSRRPPSPGRPSPSTEAMPTPIWSWVPWPISAVSGVWRSTTPRPPSVSPRTTRHTWWGPESLSVVPATGTGAVSSSAPPTGCTPASPVTPGPGWRWGIW